MSDTEPVELAEPERFETRSPDRGQKAIAGTWATIVRNGIVGALVVEIAFFAFFSDRFLTVSNFR